MRKGEGLTPEAGGLNSRKALLLRRGTQNIALVALQQAGTCLACSNQTLWHCRHQK
jgi:hypothetical protein